MNELQRIIESLLFVSEDPLTVDRIRHILPHATADDIRVSLQQLMDDYETRKGGFYLSEVAGGYQIRSRPEYTAWIKRLIQPNPVRLSRAALETLATIAYKQPIIRSDIEQIRGVDCGGILRMLLNRKLIRVLGRREIPGRPLIYATTRHFLEVFELKDLKDLPTPVEIESPGELSPEAVENDAPLAASVATEESEADRETAEPVPSEKIESTPQENGKNA